MNAAGAFELIRRSHLPRPSPDCSGLAASNHPIGLRLLALAEIAARAGAGIAAVVVQDRPAGRGLGGGRRGGGSRRGTLRLGIDLQGELAVLEAGDDLPAAGVRHRASGGHGETTPTGLDGGPGGTAVAGKPTGQPGGHVTITRRDVQAPEEGREGLGGTDGRIQNGHAHGVSSYLRVGLRPGGIRSGVN